MCRLLSVSRSGYYDWVKRLPSKKVADDLALKEKIEHIQQENRFLYGTRRVKANLEEKNIVSSRRRIANIFNEFGLQCKRKKKFRITTNSNHKKAVAPNILNREFTQSEPNKVFVGDITYVSTKEGWLFLSVFIDLFSRGVVGWSMDKRITARIVIDSLKMAIKTRKPRPGLIIHSDRGSQYVADSYLKLVNKNNFTSSMSRKGNCWDNAVAESFFKSLKSELVYRTTFETRDEAKAAIFDYIETFYNRKRMHSSIGYSAPFKYEQKYYDKLLEKCP